MESDQINQKLNALEQRIKSIETVLLLNSSIGASDLTKKNPISSEALVRSPEIKQTKTDPVVQKIKMHLLEKPENESSAGSMLGAIAVICFVLAAGFIIKLSIESGWLTPARQVVLAALFGFTLIATGLTMLTVDRGYASLLPAAGTIVLYLTVFGAYSFYSLIPYEAALICVSAVSLICIWLYDQIEHDIYPVTAAIGSYLAPVFLGFANLSDFTFYYLIICSVAFSTISIWLESRILTLVSAFLAIGLTAAIGMQVQNPLQIAVMLGIHFVIFSIGTYIYSIKNNKYLTENEAVKFSSVIFIFYASEYYYINKYSPDLAPWISLGFAAILFTLYRMAKSKASNEEMRSSPVLFAVVLMMLFHSVYLELIPSDFKPWLFPLIMFLAVFNSSKDKNQISDSVKIFFAAILAIEFFNIFSHLITKSDTQWLYISFFSILSLWTALIFSRDIWTKNGMVLLACAHALTIYSLFRLTQDNGSLAVSISWLIYAVAVIAYGFKSKDRMLAQSAVFVLGLAAGKALLYDVSAATPIVRILCLMITGVFLYAGGLALRKIKEL